MIALKGGGGLVRCWPLSFGRIFYRNAINLGLPAIRLAEAPKAAEGICSPSIWSGGDHCPPLTGGILSFAPFPPEIRKIIQGGGIIPPWSESEQLG